MRYCPSKDASRCSAFMHQKSLVVYYRQINIAHLTASKLRLFSVESQSLAILNPHRILVYITPSAPPLC